MTVETPRSRTPAPPVDAVERRDRRVVWLVAAEAGLALALGLLFLGDKTMWLDEGFTWSTASLPTGDFFSLLRHSEGNAALYSVVMHGWVTFGESETWLRLPSVVFGALSVPMTFVVGRRLFDERVGLLAGLLVAVNASVVQYSQEARTYTLTLLIALVSSYFFARDVQEPSRGSWVGWVLASALLVYAHLFGVLLLVAQAVSVVFLPPDRLRWRRLVAAGSAVVILVAPLLAILSGQEDASGLDFLTTPGVRAVVDAFDRFSGHGGFVPLAAMFVLGVLAATRAITTWRRNGRSLPSFEYGFLACWLFVPTAVALVVSIAITPAFIPRYMLYSVPALMIVAAIGLTIIPQPWLRVVALVVVLALAGRSLTLWYTGDGEKEDWREATGFVAEEARPGDGVVFSLRGFRIPFEYYLDDETADVLDPAYPAQQWGDFATGDQVGDEAEAADVQALLDDHERLWFMVAMEGEVDTLEGEGHVARLVREVAASDRLVGEWSFDGGLEVYLFAPG